MKTIEATAEVVLSDGRKIYTPVWTENGSVFAYFNNIRRPVVSAGKSSDGLAVYMEVKS